jgi:hypothetical protein
MALPLVHSTPKSTLRVDAHSYWAWLKFFLLLAIVAGCTSFGYRVGALASYPRLSAISGWDQSFYFFWLRSPLWGGEYDFTDDVRDCATLSAQAKDVALHAPKTPTGRMRNKYGVGWAFVGTPFYVAADEIAHVWKLLAPGSAPREDGVGPIYQLFLMLGQLGLAVASLILAVHILAEWFPRETGAVAVLVTWLGSFLFLYQTYHLGYAHNTVFFALTACYASAHAFRRNPGAWVPWILCGASAGLLVITRYQTAVYLLYPMVIALQIGWRSGGAADGNETPRLRIDLPWLGRIGGALVAFFAIVFVQLVAWKIVYGTWLVYSYEGEVFRFGNPELLAVLFSPFHGLFYWSPFLLVALAGFLAWLLRDRAAAAFGRPEFCWLVSLLLTYWINAAWETWWFGPAFGSRAFEGCVLFFMAGNAYLLQRLSASRWRRAALAGVTLLIVANLLLACAFIRTWISREVPVTYPEMWRGVIRHEAVAP